MSEEEERDDDADADESDEVVEEETEEEPEGDAEIDPAEDEGHEDLAVSEDMGIFSGVVGHDGAKAVVRGALRAGDVHVLLVGPPASGKSTMLDAIESNVPGTIYRDGKRFKATRVQSTFKEDPPILLIDEFDALSSDAYDVLSNPLEHGRVTEDTHNETYDKEVGTQVIAACNHTSMIPGNIKSRFREVHFTGYDDEELVEVCARMLPERVDWIETEEQAREVAEAVKESVETNDPRDVRDVARMASSVEEIRSVAVAIEDADADVESDPITPGEVERAKVEVGREKIAEEIAKGAHRDGDDDKRDVDPEKVDEEIDKAVREELEKRAEEEDDE